MMVLAFDCETTGLLADTHLIPLDKQPEVIEFYGVNVDLETGKIGPEYETLIKPKRPVSDEITRITGLTNEDLEFAPSIGFIFPQIKTFLEEAKNVVAHNASFDFEMINCEAERLGETVRWPRVICSVERTIHLKGHRLNLQALHELLFAKPFPAAHRARADVEALTRCLVELYKRGDF